MHLKYAQINTNNYPLKDIYPYNLPVLNSGRKIEFTEPVTFFAGENGSGKTTLLKAIAKSCGIYIWETMTHARVNYNPHEDNLYKFIDPGWISDRVPGHYFASRNFDFFTHLLDQWAADDPGQLDYFGGKSLMAQSHGQSLMSFFKSRYGIKGIYFLDEPETALSPRTQIALLNLLSDLSKDDNVQFIIASHSPILLSLKCAAIYNFDTDIRIIEYKDTEQFRIYRDFLLNIKS